MVSGDRLGRGSVSCGLLWSTLRVQSGCKHYSRGFMSHVSGMGLSSDGGREEIMSLRYHTVGCSRGARLCWGLMAGVLMLGEVELLEGGLLPARL